MTVYVLWGTKKGDPEWAEQLITDTSNPAHLQNAKEWARQNGFTRLRVSKHRDGDMPDFAGTLNL